MHFITLYNNMRKHTYIHFLLIPKGILNDIGNEELAHLEMVGTMVHQLLKDVPVDVLEKEGLGAYYSDHDPAVYWSH